MSPEFLTVLGRQLEVRELPGEQSGPTLVLLHEGLGCVAMWKDFPDQLNQRTGLPVFTYSRFGYGGSAPEPLPWPVDFHTREAREVLPAVLDAAAVEQCILIGHSDGASIALINAGAVNDSRILAVAALAPHVCCEQRCRDQVGAAVEAYEHGQLADGLGRYHGDNLECAFRGWSETWRDPDFESWDISHHLDAIKVPMLAVRGLDDPYNTPVHVNALGARGASVHQLAQCAHAPHVEQRDQVLDLLAAFIARVQRARA